MTLLDILTPNLKKAIIGLIIFLIFSIIPLIYATVYYQSKTITTELRSISSILFEKFRTKVGVSMSILNYLEIIFLVILAYIISAVLVNQYFK